MNCCACGKFLAHVDALPFGGSYAHFGCAAKAQLTGRPAGRVLVLVRKKGPAFDALAVRP